VHALRALDGVEVPAEIDVAAVERDRVYVRGGVRLGQRRVPALERAAGDVDRGDAGASGRVNAGKVAAEVDGRARDGERPDVLVRIGIPAE
jgi:hypothetical protein